VGFCLADMLRDSAARTPESPCLTFENETLSWHELQRRSRAVAAALRATGLVPGDRVAVIARNAPLFFELLFGCAEAGAILVPVNWRLSAREVAAVLADAAPCCVIAGREQIPLIPATPGCRLLDAERDYPSWRDATPDGAAGASCQAPDSGGLDVPRSGDDTLVLLYTSGTTGKPKGVCLSHENLRYSARMAREVWGFDATSVNLVAMPLFHVGGLGYGLMALSQGGHTVLLQQPAALPILEALARHRVTHAFFVPTVIQTLVDTPGIESLGLRTLRRIVYGAAPISETLLQRAIALFGCGFNHAYGMTETAGTVVTLQPEEHDPGGPTAHRLLSCGRPVPWVELSIRDPATGNEVATEAIGEVWIRSPMVTAGYWNNAAETAAVIREDGWLRTGDAATRDADGYIYLRDRYKDMILSGGENVFPAEVENVLAEHPDLLEVAVVGAPHERWGETVRAVVVARTGRNPQPAEIIAFCRTRLAHYKCPTRVEVVAALPKSASGKILRRELRTGG